MRFSIEIKRSAVKELERVARPRRRQIVEAIDQLSENPFRGRALKGELQGLRRVRMGDYRIVYEVRKKTLVVLVVRIAPRQSIYRR